MRATEERNKPVDGRDVARRLRETGAGVRPVPGGSTPDRPVMTGARGLLPALPRGGSGGAACGPSRPSTRGHGVGGADDIGPRQAPLGGTTTQDHRLARWAPSRPVVPRDRAGSLNAAPGGAMGRRRTGRVGLDDHRPVRRGDDRARDPPPLGVHHRRGSRGRGTISKVTDAVRRCRPGGGGAGLRVAFHPAGPPRARSAPMVRPRPPGAGDARTRIAVGAGHGRRPSTWP